MSAWSSAGARCRSGLELTGVTLVVRDYDEAIRFFTEVLGFDLIEDTVLPGQNKRWVRVAPAGSGTTLLLARAANADQEARIGHQTGGRVAFFLHTDDFWRDYRRLRDRGIEFVREPTAEAYGTVAVFEDLCGNLWDLVGPDAATPSLPSGTLTRGRDGLS